MHETWWELEVGVMAIATYQAAPVEDGADPRIGQRQMMVWACLPVCVSGRSLVWAQSRVPETIAMWESSHLVGCAQIFSLGAYPPPLHWELVRLEILEADNIALVNARCLDEQDQRAPALA